MRKITNQELNRPTADEFAAMGRIPVVVVLDNVRSAQNIGAFFRTGDAFAIERVALCGITATPPSRDIHKSALGAELTVRWDYYPTTAECVAELKAQGYRTLAIEQVEGAVMLDNLVDMCDGAIEIPQVGTKHSVNVSVAGGIVMWEFFTALRNLLQKE